MLVITVIEGEVIQVFELRDDDPEPYPLVDGVDYTVSYD